MSDQLPSEQWVPLVKYAARKGVSLSTLRRHIKADKIRYKKVKGKYLVYDDTPAHAKEDVASLKQELQRAHREIAELKTLIAFYEEQYPNA